jgi:hypothetical protein
MGRELTAYAWASSWLQGEPRGAATDLAATVTAVLLLLGAVWWLHRAAAAQYSSRLDPSTPPAFKRPLPAIHRTVVRTQLRVAAALDSETRGVLEPDQLVVVLEEQSLRGRKRARVGRLSEGCNEDLGWLSTKTAQGDHILLPLPPAEAAAAWRWRGLTLAERPTAHDDAVAAFRQAWAAHEAEVDRAPTTSAKLRHDAEQLEWLVSHGVVSEAGAAAARTLRETDRQLFADGRARGKGSEVAPIPAATLAALRGWYRAPVYVAPSARVPSGALGSSVDWVRVLDQCLLQSI